MAKKVKENTPEQISFELKKFIKEFSIKMAPFESFYFWNENGEIHFETLIKNCYVINGIYKVKNEEFMKFIGDWSFYFNVKDVTLSKFKSAIKKDMRETDYINRTIKFIDKEGNETLFPLLKANKKEFRDFYDFSRDYNKNGSIKISSSIIESFSLEDEEKILELPLDDIPGSTENDFSILNFSYVELTNFLKGFIEYETEFFKSKIFFNAVIN